MSIKNILLYVPSTEGAESALQQLQQLASAHDAHVVGLHVIDIAEGTGYTDVPMPLDVTAVEREAARQRAREIKAWFEDRVRRAGLSAQWRCVEGDTVRAVAEHALYADLVALQQNSNDGAKPDVGSLATSVGAPVIVFPRSSTGRTFGQYVLVAWDAHREAARAVRAAIPLLRLADHVDILSINPEELAAPPSNDLAAHLARHGVDVEAASAETSGLSVGERLLEQAKERQCDLLVMGAYRHSRLREAILGGTTRHVLEHAAVPVLMSH